MKLSLSALTIACIISSPLFCAQQPQKSSLPSSPQTAFRLPPTQEFVFALKIHHNKQRHSPLEKNYDVMEASTSQTISTLKECIAQKVKASQKMLHIERLTRAKGFQSISLDDASPNRTLDQLAIAESPELWVSVQKSVAAQQTAAKS